LVTVDEVNVLLDDDVAREHAVVDPIAQAAGFGTDVGPGGTINGSGVIVG
jgi:hypothetical protein